MGIEQYFAFFFGVILFILLFRIMPKYSHPSEFHYIVLRVTLALASACIAVFLTGFLRVQFKEYIEAGGALAIFLIVYFKAPAALPTDSDWTCLQSTWRNLRDINTEPGKINLDDVVKALNAVEVAAQKIQKNGAIFEPFKKGYDYCTLYKKLRDGKIYIPQKKKTSDVLLSKNAHALAKKNRVLK